MTDNRKALNKALNSLFLVVDSSVAHDVQKKVDAVIAELDDRIDEESSLYVAMMDLRDDEIRKNSKLRNKIDKLLAALAKITLITGPTYGSAAQAMCYIADIAIASYTLNTLGDEE